MIFRFAFPWAFALLPVVLAAAWWLARGRRRGAPRMPLPRAARRVRLRSSLWVRLDRTLPWVRALALMLVVFALARPQTGARQTTVSTYGVDIVIALDNSTSMSAEDFQPHNRLAVAKQTVTEFVKQRTTDRIGLVVFAGVATTRCPLTTDHAMLERLLEQVDFTPRDLDGTAIGMGLGAAANRLRNSTARSKVVVLVTDGRNNKGQIGPEAAAAAAQALGIRVYCIGVGTEGQAPIPVDAGPLGRRYVWQQLDLDEDLLQRIADTTGGEFFRATDAEALREVFRLIDELEQTKIETRERVLYTELFSLLLIPAAGLLALEGLAAATRLRRIP